MTTLRTAADTSDDGAGLFNPFPGLRPFETEEYHLFFGREGQSDALLTLLARARFLAVVGTSGSGKSSLIRAGLLPALYGGLMAGAGSAWRIAVMRPGHDPLGNLARALAEEEVLGRGLDAATCAALAEAALRRGALGLVEATRHARLEARENLLVVVDQFEELFRYKAARAASTADDAAAFVKLLLEAAAQRDVPIYVIITMRSDFLGDCSVFWGLPEAINQGQYLIPRMTRDERRDAITGPAAVGGGRISEPLVSRLLNEMGESPDQLPILQHALMKTWEHWAAGGRAAEPIGLEHYEAVGGMATALSRHADEVFAELPDERSRRIAEAVFKRLTERVADARETRRPTPLGELAAAAGASVEEVGRVVELFRREGRSFLMPPPSVALTPDTVVDIAHESLIRNWERLKTWSLEEALSARVYRRLAEAAALHAEGREGLSQDPGLQIALDWRDEARPNAAWAARYHPGFDAAMRYLDASRDARDARLAAERERERRELESARALAAQRAESARSLLSIARVLGAVAILAAAAVVFAAVMWWRASSANERERLNRHALVLIETFEMERAEDELKKLYQMLDGDREGQAWVLWNLGYLNGKLERYNQAAAFYQSALETQEAVYGPGSLETVGMLESLALALQEERSYTEATQRYEQLLSILNAARSGKGKYFQLNTANVYSDLAQLYVDQALFESYDASREGRGEEAAGQLGEARARALEQYRQAFAIWEEVLRDDKEALSSKYVKAAKFYREILDDEKTSAALELKADGLAREAGVESENAIALGQPNRGNDPLIVTPFPESGKGFVNYNRAPGGANQYARAETVRALLAVCEAWAAAHPDIPLPIGDLSRHGGGPFPPHADHQNGREVDVRPLTRTGAGEPTNIFAPNYSPELTRELVELIKKQRPNAVIRFNDPALVAAGLTHRAAGYDEYLHVLLPLKQ